MLEIKKAAYRCLFYFYCYSPVIPHLFRNLFNQNQN